MSCVLRLSAPISDYALSRVAIKPFRISETAVHFDVSTADFDDLATQANDALEYLRAHTQDLKLLLASPSTGGVLDFAVELRDAAVQSDAFPAELVREAGNLGLSLEISHYPVSVRRDAEA